MRKRSSVLSMSKLELHSVTHSSSATPSTMFSNTLVPILAALYYIAVSVSLTLFNKLLFAKFPASDPPFLLLCQSVTAVSILITMNFFSKFHPPNLLSWPKSNFQTYAPLYFSNLIMLLTSLIALKFTSLLMYNTLRRTSMIFVVVIHCVMHKTRPSPYTVAATALVTFGALIASTTDLAYDPLGYALAFTANVSTAIYLVLIRPVRDKLQLSNLQLIFVNALANIPLLILIIAFFPPKDGLLLQFSNPAFAFLFFCSCALAMVINHAIFLNTTTNDAIAQSIASQLKDVVLLITSILFVDDASQRATGNLQGVLVGFSGSLVYGVGKVLKKYQASRKIQEDKPDHQHDSQKTQSEEKVILVTNDGRIVA